jgi:hypothetical protein
MRKKVQVQGSPPGRGGGGLKENTNLWNLLGKEEKSN